MALMPMMAFAVNKQKVVLSCDLHCQGCCDKIMKNIAFEKGVKDLVCDLNHKTVTVTVFVFRSQTMSFTPFSKAIFFIILSQQP